ncbi:glycosyltransferase family 4 protein [bacterium]|nr:glycosyltransferase family 4 protein [candidate division CSSED10-310 bacterium]
MKLAIIDQSFHWPPTGGSWVDVRETAVNLTAAGIDVRIFVPDLKRWNLPGGLIGQDPGVPVETISVSLKQFNFRTLPRLIRHAVDQWSPDRIMISNTFFLAPFLIDAFQDAPLFLRIYAHEMICLNYLGLFRADTFRWESEDPLGDTCPNTLLEQSAACWRCGLRRMAGTLLGPRLNPVALEYWTGLAFLPNYAGWVRQALRKLSGIIVYTPMIRTRLASLNIPVHCVPGGVDTRRYFPRDNAGRFHGEPVRILMSGRSDDPKKGLSVYRRSIDILHREIGNDFQALVTDSRESFRDPLIRSTGWVSGEKLPELYRHSDIVVCPSIWQEPFGIVPLEGMASGLPVVASWIGGMRYTVLNGETGFLFKPGDPVELAGYLKQLIRDRKLRIRMGRAGRQRAATGFGWDHIVRKYMIPILTGSATGILDWTEGIDHGHDG